jgi:hypothetical protein
VGSRRDISLDFKGMVTAPGILSRADASCTEITNGSVIAPGLIAKRKGFERGLQNTVGNNWKAFTSRLMEGDTLIHQGGPTTGTVLSFGDGFDGSSPLATITMVGTSNLTRDGGTRMQCALGGNNHYVTADEGVARIDSEFDGATQRFAGMPRGMAPRVYAFAWGGWTPLTTGSFLAVGYARAYRVTWHLKDASGVELGGAPTDRCVVRNQTGTPGYAAGAQGVQCRIEIPNELGTNDTLITTDWFWRLWGTRTWNSVGGEQGDDEMYLISENYVTSGQISSGALDYVDNTPDSFLLKQRRLHTNVTNFPRQELGIAQGTLNEDAPPPICNDVAYWNDVMWYANCEWRQRMQVRMLAVPSNNDTVALTGPDGQTITLTAKTAPAANTEFQIYSTFATTQLNLEATARGMVEVFNALNYDLSGVRAYYVSVGNQIPGVIYFESMDVGSTDIEFSSSNAAIFTLLESGSALGASDAQPNALAFSKPLRPDAVPPINVINAGPTGSQILRIMPYRDRLLVFTDTGIYQVVGRSYADFSVQPFDLGFRLLVKEGIAVCDERVYAWCYEGIIEITDGGITVVSLPVEPTIQSDILACGSNSGGTYVEAQSIFESLGFAVAYRQKHQVLFFFPQAQSDANLNGCSYWWIWDTRTRTWGKGAFTKTMASGYLDSRSCGVVRFSDDLLILGSWAPTATADWWLFKERSAYTSADYIDDYSDETSDAVTFSMTMQYGVPETDGAVHWQQTTIQLDGFELSWRPVATQLSTVWVGDTLSLISTASVTGNTQPLIRLEVPQLVRRGNRLKLRILNVTQEYFGVVGVTQACRVGARVAQRAVS